MEQKEIKLSKNIKLIILKHYKDNCQCILGATANSEIIHFTRDWSYNYESAYRRKKYELNLWLFWVSFHIEILGKTIIL
jgi:hypothetical protein